MDISSSKTALGRLPQTYYLPPKGLKDCFTRLRDRIEAPNDSDDASAEFTIESIRIRQAAIIQMSYWLEVISHHDNAENIDIHSFAIGLIRQYVEVLYEIDEYEGNTYYFTPEQVKAGDLSIENGHMSLAEYQEGLFPGGSKVLQGNIFIRIGGYWHIRFDGKLKVVKHSNGMSFIERVLSNPEKEFDFHDLSADVEGTAPSEDQYDKETSNTEKGQYDKWGDLSEDKPHPVKKSIGLKRWQLNKKAQVHVKEYESSRNSEERLKALNDFKKATSKIDNLGEMTPAEQSYKRIKDRISRNIRYSRELLKHDFPELHEHLVNSLKTSVHYCPSPNVAWHTRFDRNPHMAGLIDRLFYIDPDEII